MPARNQQRLNSLIGKYGKTVAGNMRKNKLARDKADDVHGAQKSASTEQTPPQTLPQQQKSGLEQQPAAG